MDNIPQIEINNWDSQHDISPQPHPGITQVDYLPITSITNTFSRDTKPARKQPRAPFWSRLRRSKSDTGSLMNYSPSPYNRAPQPATAGANLVWSPKQQMWLFAREHGDMGLSSNDYHGSKSRPTMKYKQAGNRRPVTLPPSSPRQMDGEDELLFAQMPGHYSLSVYDYVGDESLQRQSRETMARVSGVTGTTTTRETTKTMSEGSWMTVASRLSEHGPL